jgi:integrase
MSLSDTAVKNAKPSSKAVRLFDAGGLYIEISPSGGKWWRLKYRYGGKEKRLSLGVYPEISLKDARQRRDDARKLLANEIDPAENRKAIKAAKSERAGNSFEVVAREWFAKKSPSWAKSNSDKIFKRLENDAFPWLGERPIAEITAPEILKSLRRIEDRGAVESAHRMRNYCGQIFRYAIATGRAERDPSADLKGAITTPVKEHHAAITEPQKVAELLRAIDAYQGYFVTRCALRLAPLFFVRPGELRKAEWVEIDLSKAEWNIPAERMKLREPHLVPLCSQAVNILTELHALTGEGKYVFPGVRDKKRPMSDNAILSALRRMEYGKEEMSGHGFRAMARTILDEVLNVRPDFIEHQLAHAVKDPNGRAYNRTAHLAERKKMMQEWADYLDKLKLGAEVVVYNRTLHSKSFERM